MEDDETDRGYEEKGDMKKDGESKGGNVWRGYYIL